MRYETVVVTYDGTIYRIGKDRIPDPSPDKWSDGPHLEFGFWTGPVTPKTIMNAYVRPVGLSKEILSD